MSSFPISSDASMPLPSLPTAGARPSLGRDDFLRLLVAQLSNQDPTSPQQGHEFAAQLAQFSSVEQLTTISSTLAEHGAMLAHVATGLDAAEAWRVEQAEASGLRGDLAAATGLIGQTVEAEGRTVVWGGSEPASIGLTLARPAASARVVIRDASGAAVRTLDLGHAGAGRQVVAWDGLDDQGQAVAPGAYTVSAEATDASGEAVGAAPFTRGRVDRVTIEADGVRFWIGGHGIPMDRLRGLAT